MAPRVPGACFSLIRRDVDDPSFLGLGFIGFKVWGLGVIEFRVSSLGFGLLYLKADLERFTCWGR